MVAAEIARQAAQIKMMRKLEKQAMAQAAKEARKQQGKQLLSSQIPLLHYIIMSHSSLICLSSSNNGCRREAEKKGADEDS